MQQDYNGDGKTDPAVLIGNILEPPGSGATTVWGKYSGTVGNVQFGVPPYSSPLRVGDLTGDGRSDYVYSAYSVSPFTCKHYKYRDRCFQQHSIRTCR